VAQCRRHRPDHTLTVTESSGQTDLPPSAADIPGVPLTFGTPVTSILDTNTKPNDVYSVDLLAGQTITIKLDAPNGLDFTRMLNPGSVTIDGNYDEAED
jgi:hypothetical protein